MFDRTYHEVGYLKTLSYDKKNSYEWFLTIEKFSNLVCYVRKISPKKKNKNKFIRVLRNLTVFRVEENFFPSLENEVDRGSFTCQNELLNLGVRIELIMNEFLGRSISYFDFVCLQKRIEKLERTTSVPSGPLNNEMR